MKFSWIQIFATIFQLITSTSGSCSSTNVGVRDELKVIPDPQMTASTNNGSGFEAKIGRLHRSSSAWCPDIGDLTPYLQIDLGQNYSICAVEVQGLPLAPLTTSFRLNSSTDGSDYTEYNGNEQFDGSAVNGSVSDFHSLSPFIARYIRFKPISTDICLRVEIYGTPEGVTVTCNQNDIQVNIDRGVQDTFKDPLDDLTLKDSGCNASFSNNSQINFDITLGTCDTTVYISSDGLKSFYLNEVINTTSAKTELDIICSYNRTATIIATENGNYSFAMNIFQDASFSIPIDPGPIALSADLYFNISVASSDPSTELHLTKCLATPTSDRNDATNYTFIENGCLEPNSQFISDYNCNKTDNFQTFVLSVFRFASSDAGSQIYFHCDAVVCLVSNASSVCNTECDACNAKRKRRALEGDSSGELAEAHLVLGPYTIFDDNPEDKRQDDIDSRSEEEEDQTEEVKDSENVPVALVVVVCVSFLVAMAIIIALLVTIRLSKNARGPAVKEVTADYARDNLAFDELDITTLSVKPNDKSI